MKIVKKMLSFVLALSMLTVMIFLRLRKHLRKEKQ